MGWRTLLLLAALAAGLGVVLLLTNSKPDQKGDVSVSLLSNHRLGSAVRLQWQREQLAPIELRRQPGGPFRITEPINDLASAAYLLNVASTYDSAMIEETPLPDTPANRQKTGLDQPRLVVDVEFEDGTKDHLEIGAEGPLGSDLFVRRDGRIYRGGLALFTALNAGLDDLRERIVFRTPVLVARELVVDRALPDGSREVMQMQRGGDGWELVAPIRARADGGAAESFVRGVLGLRIDVFPDGMLRLPEDPPALVVTVRGGVAEEVVRLWLDTQLNLMGRIESRGIAFKCLNQEYLRIFQGGAAMLRSRVLVPSADPFGELVTMVVDPGGGGPRLRLHRETKDAAWSLQEPIVGPVEPLAINELIGALANLRVSAFLPQDAAPERYGIATDGLSFSTQGFADREPTVVRIGKDGESGGEPITYAARADGPREIVAVPRDVADTIRRPWTTYVPRTIFRVQEGVTRLQLSRKDGAPRQLVRDDSGDWVDPAGAPVESALIMDIVDRLRDLQANVVLLARTQRLGEADWTVVMSRNGDPPDELGFGALEVWDRGSGPLIVHSRTGMPDLVCELKQLDSDNLRRLWH